MARAKIVGNMTELKSPTDKIVHIATEPEVDMVVTTSSSAIAALMAKTRGAPMRRIPRGPMKRPIIDPPQ